MTMIAEERAVKHLLDELLGSGGVSICVVPANRYCVQGESLSFMALALRASLFREVLIGFQLRNSTDRTVLNPEGKFERYVWDAYDLAILQPELSKRKSLMEHI